MTQTTDRPAQSAPGGQLSVGNAEARIAAEALTVPLHADRFASQQVNWWEAHLFMQAALAQANCGPLPWPGTPAWCAMSDGDPRKMLALAEFGEHHALRVETAQAALADASRDVSASADWSQIAREVQQRQAAEGSGAYIRRVTA